MSQLPPEAELPQSLSFFAEHQPWRFSGGLRLDAPQLIFALQQDLTAADYTVDSVERLLGEHAWEQFGREQTAPGRMVIRPLLETENPEPLTVMVAWWLLALEITREQLEGAFPALGLAGLQALGFASQADGAVARPAADLRPYEGEDTGPLWVASDLGHHHIRGPLPKEFVLGIGQASLTLAQNTVRTPVASALDLGTGCGIQTFHLLTHAQRVVATDISTRALNFTAFNLMFNAGQLNLIGKDEQGQPQLRADLREGSLIEPVAGEGFDLIVTNPPFVITPRTGDAAYTYRDGGLAGDRLVATLFRQLPLAMNPGGTAQMLANWEIVSGSAWHERVRSWIPEGIAAWVIQREEVPTGDYAATWLADASGQHDDLAYEQGLRDYAEDFASRGVESVGFGYVTLTRPESRSSVQSAGHVFEEISYPVERPLAPALEATLRRRAELAEADDDALASWHLVPAEDVTEERHQKPGAEHPGVILLRQGAGLRRTTLLSSALAGFVGACDGELSAGQIAGALASILEEPELAASLLPEVRQLADEGFLVRTLHIS